MSKKEWYLEFTENYLVEKHLVSGVKFSISHEDNHNYYIGKTAIPKSLEDKVYKKDFVKTPYNIPTNER